MEPARPSERFRRGDKLRRRVEFLRCYRLGGRKSGSLATLHFHPNEEGTRLGITASRKVGKAVVRQRVKRRVREIFRRWKGRPKLVGLDIVVHLKPAAGGAEYEVLKSELETLLSRLPGGGTGPSRTEQAAGRPRRGLS